MDFAIAMPDAVELARAFETAPEVVEEELTRAGFSAGMLLQREAQENAPAGVGAGGGLKGSIAMQDIRGDLGVEVGTSLAHAVPVELGTRPHRPPVQPLRDWARLVLGLGREEAERAAWGIAAKIARKGTEGQFYMRATYEQTVKQVEEIYAGAVKRIAERIA